MAGVLKTAASAVKKGLGVQPMRHSFQQQRNAGGFSDMYVKKNRYVEQWLDRRENIEREFKWDNRTLTAVLILFVGVPVGLYNALVWSAHQEDEYAGRPPRDFLWGHGSRGSS
eukprot:jgi/Chrzof1/7736/Cz02g34220.t1